MSLKLKTLYKFQYNYLIKTDRMIDVVIFILK